MNRMFLKSLGILLGALLFYRVGGHTPIPYIDTDSFLKMFNEKSEGLLQIYNLMSGGNLSRMSIFTLGIMPYISASIILFIFQIFSEPYKAMLAAENGKIRSERYKRMITTVIVLFQSMTLSTVLLSQSTVMGSLVTVSPIEFYITTFFALLTGTFCCVWLANQITAIGFGSGLSILIMFGILSSIPSNFITIKTMYLSGVISSMQILLLVAVVACGFLLVIAFENTERRVSVLKPDGVGGMRRTYYPFKANPVGIMPPIFAAICLSMPISALQLLGEKAPSFLLLVKSSIAHGTIGYAVFYAVLVFVFGFGMARLINDPKKIGQSFHSQGLMIPTIRPGLDTTNYLYKLTFSLTFISCIYLVLLCSIPEFVNYYMGIPLYLGGTSILILVSTCSDMKKNVFSMLEKDNYAQISDMASKI